MKFFNGLDLICSELSAAWKLGEVISHNIANADTPNYKARKLEFKSTLASELDTHSAQRLKTTNEKHIGGNRREYASPKITIDYSTSMRPDGNNVDVENEMVALADNNIKYSLLVQKASKEISKLRYAINEGKR